MSGAYLIMGKNCVETVIDNSCNRVLTLFTAKKDQDSLVEKAKKNGVKIKLLNKQQLSQLVNSESHQSYVAKVKPKPQIELSSILKKEPQLVVMLDSINDPQNLGAILRACECFGVQFVIWSKNRGCSLTPAATKASVGASELISTTIVSNLAETVRKFQKSGYFVVTAEISKQAESVKTIEFPEKTLLVLGSEGKGIQPLISKLSDSQVYIPMKGNIDSLNVSQATAVLLSYYQK